MAIRPDWSRRPSRKDHPTFGKRQVWRHNGGRASVERFTDSSRCFIPIAFGVVVFGEFRKLRAAQCACERKLSQ